MPSWKAIHRSGMELYKNPRVVAFSLLLGGHGWLHTANPGILPCVPKPRWAKSQVQAQYPVPWLALPRGKHWHDWPLPTVIGGHCYILIAVNHLTKWVEASSVAFATAKNVASFLLKFIFSQHGSPRLLLSDNGLNFTSQVVTELSNIFGTCPTFAAPYHPATNGAVKRANETLVLIHANWPLPTLFIGPLPGCGSPGLSNKLPSRYWALSF